MTYPKQVGVFVDYVNDIDPTNKNKDPMRVKNPDTDTESKPKAKIIYV